MKRKILIVFAAITVLVLAVAMTACNKSDTDKTPSDVSRSVSALYTGESENFAVSVEKGMREDPFIADGKATDVAEFAEITVTPLTFNDFEEISYVLNAENTNLSGTLTGNNFGEFRQTLTLDFAPVSVSVTANGTTEEIQLADVLAGKLSSSDVVNIARKEFADRIAAESADGKPSREIYVKLISGDRETYYYYVSFIGEGVDYWAMLVDPATGDVVSKK